MKYLGETFDIHAGAVDLLFPHHENEIAQSEGATGKPFVKYFIEGEHLSVNGEKMSKSLGNIFNLHDLEAKKFDPLALRYLALTAHYRSKLNFTWESLQSAQNALSNLRDLIVNLKNQPRSDVLIHDNQKIVNRKISSSKKLCQIRYPPQKNRIPRLAH
ncbi:MAG: Cysteine-tRNA ligase [Candidatus Azambacteria bacterium GW2011_GWB1_42_72]|nr:MAG: Cysteine-tRNA ligase [Candidatus Azambacteria bacterium GW2011_GWB1_42_72]